MSLLAYSYIHSESMKNVHGEQYVKNVACIDCLEQKYVHCGQVALYSTATYTEITS